MPKPTIAEAQAYLSAQIDMMCLMIPTGYSVRNIKCVRSIKPRSDEDQDLRIFSDVDMIDEQDGGPCIDVRISMSGLGSNRQDWRVQLLTRTAHELFHVKGSALEEAAKRNEDQFPQFECLYSKAVDDILETCGRTIEQILTYCLTHDVRVESLND